MHKPISQWTDDELQRAVKSGPILSDAAWRQSLNMADHLRAAAKYELETRAKANTKN